MTKSVRYYIRKDGDAATLRTVPAPSVAQSGQVAPRAEMASAAAATADRPRVSGVRRIREAIKRGGGA